MSDIVDDLKTVASAPNLLGPAAEWCGKAAAEIQRLRDELASARAAAFEEAAGIAERFIIEKNSIHPDLPFNALSQQTTNVAHAACQYVAAAIRSRAQEGRG